MRLIYKAVKQTGRSLSGSVIFFHGSGGSGPTIMEWVHELLGRNMEFPHIRVLYPTAPLQPYTPNDGEQSNVWFDRTATNIEAAENRQSVAVIHQAVREFIRKQEDDGIPAKRIIVGGFSMGGAMAMHAGYYLNPAVAGVFASGCYLNRDSMVYESLASRRVALPDLRFFHGTKDEVVPLAWGRETFDRLQQLGVPGIFTPLNEAEHEITTEMMLAVEEWIKERIPSAEK